MAPFNMSYAEQDSAFPGMLADASIVKHADTLVQGEASAEIPFGVVVAKGTASSVAGTPDDAILMVDANSSMQGVVLHSHDYTRGSDLGDVGVKPERLLAVLKTGHVYAYAEAGAFVKGQQLFVRHTANGAGKLQKGAVRINADTATAVVNKGITADESKTLAAEGYVRVNVSIAAYLASL